MPNCQSKVSKHTLKQKKLANSNEQNKLTENIHKESKTFNLLDKSFKTTVLNRLKKLRGNMSKELKDIRTIIYDQDENINKER